MLELHRVLAEFRGAERHELLGDDSATAAISSDSAHVRVATVFDDAAYRLGKYTDGTLVRLRGVVCDVQDPELVLLAAAEQDEPSVRAPVDVLTGVDVVPEFIERVPLKVALFPHRTEWAQRAYDAGMSPSHPVAATAVTSDERDTTNGNKGTKRSSEAIGASAVGESAHADSPASTGSPAGAAATAAALATATAQDAQIKKSKAEPPRSDEQGAGDAAAAPFLQDLVTVYVYDRQYKDVALDAFKVNEAFDFVGVLDLLVLSAGAGVRDVDESLSAAELQRLQISDCLDELQQRQRSGAVVHCCAVTPVTALQHLWPHARAATEGSDTTADSAPQSNDARRQLCTNEWTRLTGGCDSVAVDIAAMRAHAITHVAAAALNGDVLAAEYLVLCLLSRVYSRPDPATPLGNLSLNLIIGVSHASVDGDDSAAARVARIDATVRSLVPVCASLDLALTTLNAQPFVPRKDYATEAMCAGALQLPHGAALVVDETPLAAGQLNDQGVRNVAALQSLVAKMLLPYDFAFYSMDFPQDVAVVIVSEGKSILPVTVSVPIVSEKNASTGTSVTAMQTTESLLECLRVYFAVLRTLDVAINSAQAEVAEKHYVACRQAKQEVSLEDLHRWLRLARLVALSEGEDAVTQRTWDHMLALEDKRLERLA